MNDLARHLATEARRLGLATDEVPDPASLAAFAAVVLEELMALGLLPSPEPELGCWAQARQPTN
ncbi:hypothetical protein [Deinococcus arcticus]|uniref:Uncharacterized protein n=1 Tax=Deinococcus arcticus TaxID=2136176 RepID=A0A2T3W773_9DEIO|nr:hypothetical protein [Deinococcus arcticus]PTA67756.1 hypothetical protein C8263_11665 [Deinococcus arcticus]